jgi:hypothetical protein
MRRLAAIMRVVAMLAYIAVRLALDLADDAKGAMACGALA